MKAFFENLERLCGLCGTSGREDSVREYIINEIKGFVDVRVDAMGNIIAEKKGKMRPENRVMLDAHMDEVALIVTDINSDGLLSFACVGGIITAVLCGARVTVGGKTGVIGGVPIHLLDSDQADSLPDSDSLYIDIGASSKEEVLKYVSPGDIAYFEEDFIEFGQGLIRSKAIDDRFGCAVLMDMIKREQPYDLTFTFSVQEEIGLRGAKAAAYGVDPDYAVVIEATTAADVSGVKPEREVCNVGGGAVISFMDSASVYDRGLFELAGDVAEENRIKFQIKRAVAGGNNAGSIIRSRGGVKTAALSLPCRYIHSQASVASREDMLSVARLAEKLAERLASGKVLSE